MAGRADIAGQNGKRPGGRRAGFTLLEIMIALAIVAIAMVALLGLGNRSIAVHDRLQHLTRATLLAEQKMAESELAARRAGVAELAGSSGTFDEPFQGYSWRIAVESTPLPAVQKVTVRVSWGDAARNEEVDVTSFIF